MTTYQILSWHGIPAGVRVKNRKEKVNKHLPQRFQVAIDAVAMAVGKVDSSSYMAGWQYSEPVERQGTCEDVSNMLLDELAAEYSPDKLRALREKVERGLKEIST
jgi:hypothetical protein